MQIEAARQLLENARLYECHLGLDSNAPTVGRRSSGQITQLKQSQGVPSSATSAKHNVDSMLLSSTNCHPANGIRRQSSVQYQNSSNESRCSAEFSYLNSETALIERSRGRGGGRRRSSVNGLIDGLSTTSGDVSVSPLPMSEVLEQVRRHSNNLHIAKAMVHAIQLDARGHPVARHDGTEVRVAASTQPAYRHGQLIFFNLA